MSGPDNKVRRSGKVKSEIFFLEDTLDGKLLVTFVEVHTFGTGKTEILSRMSNQITLMKLSKWVYWKDRSKDDVDRGEVCMIEGRSGLREVRPRHE